MFNKSSVFRVWILSPHYSAGFTKPLQKGFELLNFNNKVYIHQRYLQMDIKLKGKKAPQVKNTEEVLHWARFTATNVVYFDHSLVEIYNHQIL